MADTIVETVQKAAENITENANVKIPATPEGMFIAYSSLVIMALLPIFFGSKRSLSNQKEHKVIHWISEIVIALYKCLIIYRLVIQQKSPIL